MKIKLHGARQLERNLRDLPKRLAKSTIRRALVKSAEPVRADAAARAGQTKPNLAKAVMIRGTLSRRQRRGRRKRANTVEVFLGVTARQRGIAHLIEFGTGPRTQRSTGRYTGIMPARPFLRPAWEAGRRRILQRFGPLLGAEIERSAARLAKRQAKKAAGG